MITVALLFTLSEQPYKSWFTSYDASNITALSKNAEVLGAPLLQPVPFQVVLSVQFCTVTSSVAVPVQPLGSVTV